jgi:hypothetical protein
MNKYKKMNAKKTLVSFLLIASVLFLASAVSAYTIAGDYSNLTVKVNGDTVATAAGLPTVNAGDTLDVKVSFTYNDLSVTGETDNIKVKATLEGEKDDVVETTSAFDVEEGKTYTKTVTLKVPEDFDKDLTNGDFSLTLKIGDEEVELGNLHVQRTSYEASIKSVMASSAVEAGQSVSVEVALENTGYNDLEDMYVTVKIPELSIEKRAYFGDLVTVAYDGDDEDAENTVRGTLNLDVPYTAKAGKYTLVVEAENEDAASSVKKEITISNSVSDIAMKSGNDLVLLNPTNQLKVYKLVYQSNEVVVILPAASTKTVPITVPASGDYSFDISVFSGDVLLSTVKFSGSQAASAQLTSPVFVLTVILAIVFLVLLVALVVLITKKPQKTEEFGESYY